MGFTCFFLPVSYFGGEVSCRGSAQAASLGTVCLNLARPWRWGPGRTFMLLKVMSWVRLYESSSSRMPQKNEVHRYRCLRLTQYHETRRRRTGAGCSRILHNYPLILTFHSYLGRVTRRLETTAADPPPPLSNSCLIGENPTCSVLA